MLDPRPRLERVFKYKARLEVGGDESHQVHLGFWGQVDNGVRTASSQSSPSLAPLNAALLRPLRPFSPSAHPPFSPLRPSAPSPDPHQVLEDGLQPRRERLVCVEALVKVRVGLGVVPGGAWEPGQEDGCATEMIS
jgi:hypothetical protein